MFRISALLRRSAPVCLVTLLCALAVMNVQAQDTSEQPPQVIHISLTEYTFSIKGQAQNTPLELRTGQPYEIHFRNDGSVKHEVLMGKQPKTIEGGFRHDYAELLLSDVEVSLEGESAAGSFAIGMPGLNEFELPQGQEFTILFTLSAEKVGQWEIGCFMSLDPNAPEDNLGMSHYDMKMHIPVEIVAGT